MHLNLVPAQSDSLCLIKLRIDQHIVDVALQINQNLRYGTHLDLFLIHNRHVIQVIGKDPLDRGRRLTLRTFVRCRSLFNRRSLFHYRRFFHHRCFFHQRRLFHHWRLFHHLRCLFHQWRFLYEGCFF